MVPEKGKFSPNINTAGGARQYHTFLWWQRKVCKRKPPRTPSPDDRVPSLARSFNPAVDHIAKRQD